MSILSSLRKELNKISSIAEDLGKNIKNILRYSEDVSTSSEEAAPTIVKEEKVKSTERAWGRVFGTRFDVAKAEEILNLLGFYITERFNYLAMVEFTKQDLNGEYYQRADTYWTKVYDDKYINWAKESGGSSVVSVIDDSDGAFIERKAPGTFGFDRASDRFPWSPKFSEEPFSYQVNTQSSSFNNYKLSLSIEHSSPLTPLLLRFYSTNLDNLILPISAHDINVSNSLTFLFWWSTPPPPLPNEGLAFLTPNTISHPGTGGGVNERNEGFVSKMDLIYREIIEGLPSRLVKYLDWLFENEYVFISGKHGAFETPESYKEIELQELDAYTRAQEFISKVSEKGWY